MVNKKNKAEEGMSLEEFVKEASKKLNLQCILQFGSSTIDQKADDIDLVLFSKKEIFTTKDYINLFELMKSLENKHELVFDIGGKKVKREGGLNISVVPINSVDIKLVNSSNFTVDIFFFKNLSEDKNKKVLFGKDPTNIKIILSKEQIIQSLSMEVNHALRDCLESEKAKKDSMYYLFKTTLRLTLANHGNPQKKELISLFKKIYPAIKLPKNYTNYINKKLDKNYFEEILKFSEDCLKFLINN